MMAYNSENYIAETIRSVLNQTEPNIQLLIRNNGSTDNTEKICRQFQKKDKRIIYLHNQVNMLSDEGKHYPDRSFWPTHFAGEYVSMIDSDDLLAPQFTKEMYQAAKSIDADIVIAGTTMFEDKSKRIMTQRIPPSIIAKDMRFLAESFSELYGSLRPVWGKIYRTEFFEQFYDFAWNKPEWMSNGMDTYASLGYLMSCQRLVALNKSLHFYRMRQQSAFQAKKVDTYRIKAGKILYDRGFACIEKLQISTFQNKQYLASVYWGHQLDLLQLLDQTTEMTTKEKLNFIETLVNEPMIGELLTNQSNFQTIYERIKQSLQTTFTNKDCVEAEQYPNHFLNRLYHITQQSEQQQNQLSGMILLSVVADEKNGQRFGWQLLEKYKKILSAGIKQMLLLPDEKKKALLNDPVKLREFILQIDQNQKVQELELFLQQALEAEEIEQAIASLNAISAISPLNVMSLYFRIYFAYLAGDIAFARLIACAAKVFWPDHSEIKQIYKDIWNNTQN